MHTTHKARRKLRSGRRRFASQGGSLLLLLLSLTAGGLAGAPRAEQVEGAAAKSEPATPPGKAPVRSAAKDDPAAAEQEVHRLFDYEETREPDRKVTPRSDSMVQFADRRGRSYELDLLVALDLVGSYDNEAEKTTENQFVMREAEIGFRASIDHLAEGVLMIAAHDEGGAQFWELHEAYFLFPATFVPNTSLKVGKFFFDVGRLNSIHRHDWSFTMAPVVHAELFDPEAVSDTGAELRILMPWTSFWQELTLGVFNGRVFGHAHNDGNIKQNPMVTAHLKQFLPLGGDWGTQFGISYLRYHATTNPNQVTQLTGLDLLVKWSRGKLRSFQWLSEVWYRETRQKNERPFDEPAPPVETRVGAYTFLEYQFHQNWFVGFRYDAFTDPNLRGDLGYTIRNGTAAESLMVTFRPSEFSYFRLTAERKTNLENGERSYQGYVQLDFILGAHPPHKY